MMEAGRAWWVILSTENCNHAGAYCRVRMKKLGPLEAHCGWEGADFGVGVGLEGNTEGVKQVFAPREFVCLGPGLEGFTPIPCVYKNQIYNTSPFLLRMNTINQIILKTGASPCP